MSEIISRPNVELLQASDVPKLLDKIRPSWQAKDLINRVKKLIMVDPSSACQRLFNAAIHDIREKIVVAGIDIAKEAGRQNKLPSIERPNDIEEYPTSKLIDLAHFIGLISRPEWKRLIRCYEIRRDLEHEDDEYEAGIEDCIYIFQTCINVILARDPIHLLKVTDVKTLIEQPAPAVPAPSLLEEYEHAPQPRQEEILRLLVSIGWDSKQLDLVRQNAVTFLSHFASLTQNPVKLKLAEHIQDRIKNDGPTRVAMRIAFISGILPYIKQAYIKDFFEALFKNMEQISHRWRAHASHGELLRSFNDVGGLIYCPSEPRKKILKWMILAYIGESGGYTSYGNYKHVFYSYTAESLITELITQASTLVRNDLRALSSDKDIKKACYTQHIERRLETLLDLVEEKTNT